MSRGGEERRAHVRYRVNIPALMETGSGVMTGICENLSASGALLTHPTGDLEVGARGTLRLMNLAEALHTASEDTLHLEAEIVRRQLGGFGLRFLGDTERLHALLQRAFGRRAIERA